VRPAGRYRGRSELSCGFRHGLQRTTDTRRLESLPGASGGRSNRSSLAPRGRRSGQESAVQGPTARILYGPGRGGVVYPNPAAWCVGGDFVERVEEGGVASLDARNRDGVLFANDVVRAALAVGCEVTVRYDVPVQTLVSTPVAVLEYRQR